MPTGSDTLKVTGLISRVVPMITLYHYTSAAGLEGIITSKSIWASDYRFLNDSTEFEYGMSVFDKFLKSESHNLTVLSGDVMEVIENFRRTTPDTNVFIASFSEVGDLLSQWRGYNGGLGFSLGIKSEWLRTAAAAQGFRLLRVRYTPQDHERIIRREISRLMSLLSIKTSVEPAMHWTNLKLWWETLLEIVPIIKDTNFIEEREHRLIRAYHGWPPGVSVRATANGLIPFIRLSLASEDGRHVESDRRNIGIERILIGPALHERQHQAVDALLASQHMRVEVRKSRIPFVAT